MRPVPVSALHSMAKPGATVHVHGVCTAVESVQKRVACRVVKCPHCEAVQTHLLGIWHAHCRPAARKPAAWAARPGRRMSLAACLFR